MPVNGNILYCQDCNHHQPQINLTNCEKCGHDLGAPNVNIVSTDDELIALQKRYDNARKHASNNGTENALNRFEDYFNANVKAIKNIPLKTLRAWVVQTGSYKTYHRAVEEGLRDIADLFNDRKRTIIDSYLYGTYGRDINSAALTLNDNGLESYGNCRVILNEDSIKSRSSTLEENPFNFVKTHNINLEKSDIPAGYRSTWQNKLKLAVAKLHTKFTSDSVERDFIGMILLSTGNRETDEFIEVHIYKKLTNFAIECIYVPTLKNRSKDKLSIKAIEEKLPGKVKRF